MIGLRALNVWWAQNHSRARRHALHRSGLVPALQIAALVSIGAAAIQPAAAQDTGKTGLNSGKSSSPLKFHHDAELGFSFRYPGIWQMQKPGGRRGEAKVGGADGASCTVSVKRQNIAADQSGRPLDLDVYLGRLKRDKFSFPARFKAQITEFESTTLGGQPAKRLVIDLGINRTKLVQYLTFRSYGIIVLTCIARDRKFSTPEMQRHIKTVQQSFRF